MTRRAASQLGVDRMVSISWSGEPAVKPPAHQGRASARGLEGRLTLQHPHPSDQTSWKSRCRASFSLAIKHGIYRDTQQTPSLGHGSTLRHPWHSERGVSSSSTSGTGCAIVTSEARLNVGIRDKAPVNADVLFRHPSDREPALERLANSAAIERSHGDIASTTSESLSTRKPETR